MQAVSQVNDTLSAHSLLPSGFGYLYATEGEIHSSSAAGGVVEMILAMNSNGVQRHRLNAIEEQYIPASSRGMVGCGLVAGMNKGTG